MGEKRRRKGGKESKEVNYSDKNKFLRERELLKNVLNYFDEDIIQKLSKADGAKWVETIEKLHRIDGYDFETIEKVIIWGRTNEFWSQNFISIAALRKKKNGVSKFQQILKRMEGEKNGLNQKNQKRAILARQIAEDIANDTNWDS